MHGCVAHTFVAACHGGSQLAHPLRRQMTDRTAACSLEGCWSLQRFLLRAHGREQRPEEAAED